MELLILCAIAAGLIAVFLFFGEKKRTDPFSATDKPTPHQSPETVLTPDGLLAETDEEALQNPIEALRGQIRAGAETLFCRSLEDPMAGKHSISVSSDIVPHTQEAPDTGAAALSAKIPKMADSPSYGKAQRDRLMECIDSIPNFRSVHHRLQELLNHSATSAVSSLSSVIVGDPVLSAKVLKMVNSAYFGRSQKINSIGHALILLGMVQLRELLYREGMLAALKVNDPGKDLLIDTFWRHAAITSICASHISGLFPGLDQGTLFTAGLLHDIGKIILVRMDDRSEYTTQSTREDESRIFGIDHVEAGRLALEHWGFSDLMISVVENHHAPAAWPLKSLKVEPPVTQYLLVIFFADQLAKMIQPGQDYRTVDPVHASYHPVVNPDRFTRSALDGVLLTKIIKSEAFTA